LRSFHHHLNEGVPLPRNTKRLLGATVGLLVGLIAASPAMAASIFTQSQITSPGDPYVLLDKAGDSNTVTVTGTTNAGAGNTVNIRCYYTRYYGGSTYFTVGSTTTDADGTFTTLPLSVSSLSSNYQACTMRAVPSSPPSDLGSFKGPRTAVIYYDPSNSTYAVHGGDGTGFPADYFVDAPGFRGDSEFYSAGSDGLYYLSPGVSNTGPSETADDNFYGWGYGGGLFGSNYDSSGPGVIVDDHPAYNAYATPTNDYDQGGPESTRKPAGWTPVSSDVQTAPNGDVKITETDRFNLCADDTFPATDTSCASVSDSGVHFTRVMLVTNGSTKVDMTDSFASADGQAHSMALQFQNYIYQYEYPAFNFSADPANQWGVVGDDTQIENPGTPGGFAYRDNEYPDDQYDTANGSLVWLTQPARLWFDSYGTYPTLEYNLAIPAGGAATLHHVFQVANLSSDALAGRNAVEDATGAPVVTFASPANNTATDQSHATLTGAATDNKGVKSLTINGVSVAMANDGTFAFPATLVQGANTFSAVATDASGNTGTASLVLTYVKADPLAPLCKVPSVKKSSKLSAAKQKLVAANCTPKTHKMFSSKVKKGRVISLGAKASQVFVPKANITVNVSKGKKKHTKAKKAVKH
jgi:hypothetical protein